jgi:hypothetical protein
MAVVAKTKLQFRLLGLLTPKKKKKKVRENESTKTNRPHLRAKRRGQK